MEVLSLTLLHAGAFAIIDFHYFAHDADEKMYPHKRVCSMYNNIKKMHDNLI